MRSLRGGEGLVASRSTTISLPLDTLIVRPCFCTASMIICTQINQRLVSLHLLLLLPSRSASINQGCGRYSLPRLSCGDGVRYEPRGVTVYLEYRARYIRHWRPWGAVSAS